jgi:propanediol utilization protein
VSSATAVAEGTGCVTCGVCMSVRDWEGPDGVELLEHLVRGRVEDALREQGLLVREPGTVPIGVSARHVHLSSTHVEALFGIGTTLQPWRTLFQPGEFATEHTLTLRSAAGRAIDRVRVLGPERSRTQIEISRTDAVALRQDVPLRNSGDLDGSPEITLEGPSGSIVTDGLIRAARHIHCDPAEAAAFGFQDGDRIPVRVPGPEGLTFPDVLIRAHPGHRLILHLDTDDANASGVSCVTHGLVLSDLMEGQNEGPERRKEWTWHSKRSA